MKTIAIATAVALFAGMAAPAYAFDSAAGLRAPSQVTRVSCDTRKDDDQAVCAEKCEDTYIRHKQDMMADHAKLKADRKACDEKCGCPQNSKDL